MTKKWTYEACKIEASKYKTKKEFRKMCACAHEASYRNGWLDEFYPKHTAHR